MNELEFKTLFVHRTDAFAEQQRNGSYFPVRDAAGEDVTATEAHVEEHLAGMASYGSYIIRPSDQTVAYLVFDLDTMDEQALNWLKHSAEVLVGDADKRCLGLEWSGKKGYHVWLWLERPVTAASARKWVDDKFLPEWKVLADEFDWPLEVFPKQDFVEEGGYGNLVKWPLGVHAVTGARSEWIAVEGWCESPSVSKVVPCSTEQVPRVAAPERQRAITAAAVNAPPRSGDPQAGEDYPRGMTGEGGGNPPSPFPCVDRIARGDVTEGNRNNAFFHLALYYYGHGIPQEVGLHLVGKANAASERPLTEREVRTLVRSAYAGRRRGASCGQGWLRGFCPGPCRAGNSVGPAAGGELRYVTAGDRLNVEVVAVNTSTGSKRVTVRHPDAINQPTLVARTSG